MVSTEHSSESLQGAPCPEEDGQTATQEARENVARLSVGTAPPDGSGKALLVTQHPKGVGEREGLGRDSVCPWEGHYKWKATGCKSRKWASASGCDKYKGHRLTLLL